MMKITKVEDNKVYYTCSCGVRGRCVIKPLTESEQKVVIITCPNCLTTENIRLDAGQIVSNEDTFYSLVLTLNNEIIEEFK